MASTLGQNYDSDSPSYQPTDASVLNAPRSELASLRLPISPFATSRSPNALRQRGPFDISNWITIAESSHSLRELLDSDELFISAEVVELLFATQPEVDDDHLLENGHPPEIPVDNLPNLGIPPPSTKRKFEEEEEESDADDDYEFITTTTRITHPKQAQSPARKKPRAMVSTTDVSSSQTQLVQGPPTNSSLSVKVPKKTPFFVKCKWQDGCDEDIDINNIKPQALRDHLRLNHRHSISQHEKILCQWENCTYSGGPLLLTSFPRHLAAKNHNHLHVASTINATSNPGLFAHKCTFCPNTYSRKDAARRCMCERNQEERKRRERENSTEKEIY